MKPRGINEDVLKLWYIYQNEVTGYDTYDSAVVVAKDEESAKKVPIGAKYAWPQDPQYVEVQYLGEADSSLKDGEIICTSFNAG